MAVSLSFVVFVVAVVVAVAVFDGNSCCLFCC